MQEMIYPRPCGIDLEDRRLAEEVRHLVGDVKQGIRSRTFGKVQGRDGDISEGSVTSGKRPHGDASPKGSGMDF